jgi:cytochrome c-type biogenesis protein CcmH
LTQPPAGRRARRVRRRSLALLLGSLAVAALAVLAARSLAPRPEPKASAPVNASATIDASIAGMRPAMRPGISGRVDLAPELRSRIRAGSELVVAAYAVDRPRVPLALRRQSAQAFPADFTLDDAAAVNPAFRLSMATQLIVVARIAPPGSGDAGGADFEGRSAVVPAGAHGVQVRIDRPGP